MTMCKFNQILCTMPCRLRSFHSLCAFCRFMHLTQKRRLHSIEPYFLHAAFLLHVMVKMTPHVSMSSDANSPEEIGFTVSTLLMKNILFLRNNHQMAVRIWHHYVGFVDFEGRKLVPSATMLDTVAKNIR